MLKHIVMWRFKEEAEGNTKQQNLELFKESVERLVGIVPEIVSLEIGINVVKSDMAYDAVLVSVFEDESALQRYTIHPEHKKVSEFCKKVRESRVVVDYYI